MQNSNELRPEDKLRLCQIRLVKQTVDAFWAGKVIQLRRLVDFFKGSAQYDENCISAFYDAAWENRDLDLLKFALEEILLGDPRTEKLCARVYDDLLKACQDNWKQGAELIYSIAYKNRKEGSLPHSLPQFVALLHKDSWEISLWIIRNILTPLPDGYTRVGLFREVCESGNLDCTTQASKELQIRLADIHSQEGSLFFLRICLRCPLEVAQWIADVYKIQLRPEERGNFFAEVLANGNLPMLRWVVMNFAYSLAELLTPHISALRERAAPDVKAWMKEVAGEPPAKEAGQLTPALGSTSRPAVQATPDAKGDAALGASQPAPSAAELLEEFWLDTLEDRPSSLFGYNSLENIINEALDSGQPQLVDAIVNSLPQLNKLRTTTRKATEELVYLVLAAKNMPAGMLWMARHYQIHFAKPEQLLAQLCIKGSLDAAKRLAEDFKIDLAPLANDADFVANLINRAREGEAKARYIEVLKWVFTS